MLYKCSFLQITTHHLFQFHLFQPNPTLFKRQIDFSQHQTWPSVSFILSQIPSNLISHSIKREGPVGSDAEGGRNLRGGSRLRRPRRKSRQLGTNRDQRATPLEVVNNARVAARKWMTNSLDSSRQNSPSNSLPPQNSLLRCSLGSLNWMCRWQRLLIVSPPPRHRPIPVATACRRWRMMQNRPSRWLATTVTQHHQRKTIAQHSENTRIAPHNRWATIASHSQRATIAQQNCRQRFR